MPDRGRQHPLGRERERERERERDEKEARKREGTRDGARRDGTGHIIHEPFGMRLDRFQSWKRYTYIHAPYIHSFIGQEIIIPKGGKEMQYHWSDIASICYTDMSSVLSKKERSTYYYCLFGLTLTLTL